MKKLMILLLAMTFVLGSATSCSMYDAYATASLTARAIVVTDTYSSVEYIVADNLELFNEADQAKLQTASKAFNDLLITIRNLTGTGEAFNTEQVFVDIAQFENIWLRVKVNYGIAKGIIEPVIVAFTENEQMMLYQFDKDAQTLALQVDDLKKRIEEGTSKLTGGEQIDITAILQDIALFSGAVAKVIATKAE